MLRKEAIYIHLNICVSSLIGSLNFPHLELRTMSALKIQKVKKTSVLIGSWPEDCDYHQHSLPQPQAPSLQETWGCRDLLEHIFVEDGITVLTWA